MDTNLLHDSRIACSYPRIADGLNGSPERLRIVPAWAPSSHVSQEAARVTDGVARSRPRRTSPIASARHAFAAANVGNVMRILRPARRS